MLRVRATGRATGNSGRNMYGANGAIHHGQAFVRDMVDCVDVVVIRPFECRPNASV